MTDLDITLSRKIDYDPELITTYARKLYDKADHITFSHTLAFGACGGLGAYWYTNDDGTGVFLGILFAVIGYVIGEGKSFHYRLEAQVALCQAKIEENTRALTDAPLESQYEALPSLTATRKANL